jgi:hypothetical protein
MTPVHCAPENDNGRDEISIPDIAPETADRLVSTLARILAARLRTLLLDGSQKGPALPKAA